MALGPIPREAYVEFIHGWLKRGQIEAREDFIWSKPPDSHVPQGHQTTT